MKEYRDFDLILVDTAGINPYDREQREGLGLLTQEFQPEEIHLVLEATTRQKDLQRIAQAFFLVPITQLLFTKLDLTDNFGGIFSLSIHNKKSLSYLGCGPGLPDDIQAADTAKLAELMGLI